PGLPPINDGTDKPGVAESLNQWYFAEGTTRGDFRTFYTIQNPQTATVTAAVNYFVQGAGLVTKNVDLPPQSRTTIQVYNGSQPGALGTPDVDFGTFISTPAGQGIIVERPLYEQHVFPDPVNGNPINGGSDVFGLPDNCTKI